MTTSSERRCLFDRRSSRQRIVPLRVLGLYLLAALIAAGIVYRNDQTTREALHQQCLSTQAARQQSNHRNAILRQTLALTAQSWAARSGSPEDKAADRQIAAQYRDLSSRIQDIKINDCKDA